MAKKAGNTFKLGIPQWAKPVVNVVRKVAEPAVKVLVKSPPAKALFKALPQVVSPVSKSGSTGNKKITSTPKTVQPAKSAPAKEQKSLKKEVIGSISSNIKPLDTSKVVNSNLKDKGISILGGWKKETQEYFDNITKGVTQCGAAPYFLLRPIEPLSETEYYLIQLQKVVSSETGFSNFLESYNNTKASIKNDINKAGNEIYNSNTPYLSNFVGSLTNSSDYREKGPLDLENKAVNKALAISNVFSRGLITGGSTIVGDLSDIINDSNINMASVYGSQLGGLLEGGAKTIEGIADFGINPLGIKEGVSDFLRNEKENLPALWNKATDYVSHMSTEASPQEKARLEGRIMFEVLSIYALAKIGKLGEGAKAVQEGAVLEGAEQQTSKLSEIFKRRGVTINKTEAELMEGTGKAAGSGAAKEGAIEGAGNTRVGRWMSQAEYDKMVETGRIQMSGDNKVHVANPADIEAFGKQAPKGSLYVEFDVSSSTMSSGGTDGWGIINGPGSLLDRLNAKKGLPRITEMPQATNIEIKGSK